MRRNIFLSILVIIFTFSCAMLPKKQYEKVTVLREKALKYDKLKDYSRDEYNKAEDEYSQARDIMENEERKKEGKIAKSSLKVAEENYKTVVSKMPDYALDLKDETDTEIAKADSIKANVDLATVYLEASAYYEEAKDSVNKKDYDKAIDSFLTAKSKYNEAYVLAKRKYEKSESSLKDARAKLTELEKMQKELSAFQSKK